MPVFRRWEERTARTNSTQKSPSWGLKQKPSCCEATVLTTAPPCRIILWTNKIGNCGLCMWTQIREPLSFSCMKPSDSLQFVFFVHYPFLSVNSLSLVCVCLFFFFLFPLSSTFILPPLPGQRPVCWCWQRVCCCWQQQSESTLLQHTSHPGHRKGTHAPQRQRHVSSPKSKLFYDLSLAHTTVCNSRLPQKYSIHYVHYITFNKNTSWSHFDLHLFFCCTNAGLFSICVHYRFYTMHYSVHYFAPDSVISTSIGWISMKQAFIVPRR